MLNSNTPLIGTRPVYENVDAGLEAQRVVQLFSHTGSFGPRSPTGLYDSVPVFSPHSPNFPTRSLIEVQLATCKYVLCAVL